MPVGVGGGTIDFTLRQSRKTSWRKLLHLPDRANFALSLLKTVNCKLKTKKPAPAGFFRRRIAAQRSVPLSRNVKLAAPVKCRWRGVKCAVARRRKLHILRFLAGLKSSSVSLLLLFPADPLRLALPGGKRVKFAPSGQMKRLPAVTVKCCGPGRRVK